MKNRFLNSTINKYLLISSLLGIGGLVITNLTACQGSSSSQSQVSIFAGTWELSEIQSSDDPEVFYKTSDEIKSPADIPKIHFLNIDSNNVLTTEVNYQNQVLGTDIKLNSDSPGYYKIQKSGGFKIASIEGNEGNIIFDEALFRTFAQNAKKSEKETDSTLEKLKAFSDNNQTIRLSDDKTLIITWENSSNESENDTYKTDTKTIRVSKYVRISDADANTKRTIVENAFANFSILNKKIRGELAGKTFKVKSIGRNLFNKNRALLVYEVAPEDTFGFLARDLFAIKFFMDGNAIKTMNKDEYTSNLKKTSDNSASSTALNHISIVKIGRYVLLPATEIEGQKVSISFNLKHSA